MLRSACILLTMCLTACGIHPQQKEVISGFSQGLEQSSSDAAQMLQWHSADSQQIKLALSVLDETKQALNCQQRQLNLRPVQCAELERPINQAMLEQRLQVLNTCQLYARSLDQLVSETDLKTLHKSLLNLNAALAKSSPEFSAGQQQALADISTQITGWFVAHERYVLAREIIRELGPLITQMLQNLSADLVLSEVQGERGFIDSHQRLAQDLRDETQQRLQAAAQFSLTERSWLFEQQYNALQSLQRISQQSTAAQQQLIYLQRVNGQLIQKIAQSDWDKQTWLALAKEIQQFNQAIQVSGVLNE